MNNKTLFADSLFALRNFVSDVDDMIETVSIHYSGFIVIYFDPNASKETIQTRLKDYGITDFEFSNDNRQVFIYK
jgi:hypothetical protein